MDNYYKIKLHRKNSDIDTCALVSLNKIAHVENYKWYLGKDGYPFTYIKGGRVLLHRLVWYINTGSWANELVIGDKIVKHYVDHINRNKLDARDENLRLATPAQNSYNKTSKNTLTDPETNQPLHHIKLTKSGYVVSICKDGITNRIDSISTLEEAKKIYNLMAEEMFGEFAVLYDV
jgi:hypothetical protein